jgi:hypothetical protein
MSPAVRGPHRAALLLCLLAACDPTSDRDPAPEGGGPEVDAGSGGPGQGEDAGEAACAPEGASEARIRYEDVQATGTEPCVAEPQARVCLHGQWSAWSGTFASETCVPGSLPTCDGAAEGATEARVRYREPTGTSSAPCAAQTQTRSCRDGAWSDWSGDFAADTCLMQGPEPEPCGTTPSGSSAARVRYRQNSVPFGERCVAEVQTRECDAGVWSPWSGGFEHEQCSEAAARACGSIPHGTPEARVRYANRLVPFGEACVAETQTRVCTDGTFSRWSGEHAEERCEVAASGAAVLASPASGDIATIEGGPAVAITFAPSIAPSAPVSIVLTSSDARALTVTGAALTLEAGSTAERSAELLAPRTLMAEGKRHVLLRASVTSDDARFDGLAVGPWSVSIDDAGKAGLVIAELTERVTTDAGGEALLELSLARAPLSDVSVYVTSTDTTEGAPAPGRLTFTAANFATPQLVRVRGVDDAPLVDGEVSFQVLLDAVSADESYGLLPLARLAFVSRDVPVNECARGNWHSCGSGQVCLDKEPGFACGCAPGRELRAGSCQPVASVSTGDWHSCQRKSSGELSCWGLNEAGSASLPAGRSYVAVAAGADHTCALETNGTITCAGSVAGPGPTAAVGARWIDVRSGEGFSCALDNLGDITCFGLEAARLAAPLRHEPRRFRSLRVNGLDLCAQDDSLALTCVRAATDGLPALPLPVPPAGTSFVGFEVASHVCAIDSAGGLTCAPDRWGYVREAPPALPDGVYFRRLAIDDGGYSCAIDSRGALACWGALDHREQALAVPQLPEGVSYEQVAAQNSHACALDSLGKVHCWGYDSVGQAQVPDPVAGGRWQSLDSGSVHTCAIDDQGRLNCWGWDDTEPALAEGARWTSVQTSTPQSFFYSAGSTCAVDSLGGGQCWGSGGPDAPELGEGEGWKKLAAGYSLACGITIAGSMRCRDATPPVLAEGVLWTDVDAYGDHACATDSTGTLHCFGSALAPRVIAQREGGFSQLDVKRTVVCAIHGAGAMDCWNMNGSSANASRPALPPGAGWAHVSLWNHSRHASHLCAVDTLGNAYCWGGSNPDGSNDVPALEAGVRWTRVETGESFSCGLDSRARRHCWGVRKLSPF